jgi:hypothetical protein
VPVESVRCTGRNTMGVKVMNLRGADKVSSMARLVGGTNGNGGGDGDSGLVAGLAAAHEETEDLEDVMDLEDDEGEDFEADDDLQADDDLV